MFLQRRTGESGVFFTDSTTKESLSNTQLGSATLAATGRCFPWWSLLFFCHSIDKLTENVGPYWRREMNQSEASLVENRPKTLGE